MLYVVHKGSCLTTTMASYIHSAKGQFKIILNVDNWQEVELEPNLQLSPTRIVALMLPDADVTF